jgi:hypothetical protein
MGFDVFISYPHEDKATADAACATLEAAGMRCWIAPRDVTPSADWAASIIEAIDSCRVMVLIFSSRTNKSKQVHREVQRAFDQEKPVVPFRIENMLPEKTLAYYMGSVHWLDALTPPLEQHLTTLAESVKGLLRVPEAAGGKYQLRREVDAEPQGAKARRLRYEAESKSPVAEKERRQNIGPGRKPSRSAMASGIVIGAALLVIMAIWFIAARPKSVIDTSAVSSTTAEQSPMHSGAPVATAPAPTSVPAPTAPVTNDNPAVVTKSVKREVSLGYLNLRSGPGQDQKVLARIPAGSTGVVMTGSCVAPKDSTSSYPFCLVEWNGLRGWVSSNGLE